MRIRPILNCNMDCHAYARNNGIIFGYSSPLKTLWKKGKLPSVKYGFYGDRLTQSNLSLEHLLPHSKGGKTKLDNLVLASKENNQARGNANIKDYLTVENVTRYLEQFKGIKRRDFDGQSYITGVINTLKGLLNAN